MTISSAKLTANTGSERVVTFTGQFLLWLLLSVALVRLPQAPQVDPLLDNAWGLCLPYLTYHGMQFGSDAVFTFGPLGFVIPGLYSGCGYWMQFIAMAAVGGMFGWVIVEATGPLKWPFKIIAILAIVFLITRNIQTEFSLIIALQGLLLLRDEPPGRIKTTVCLIVLGFLSLTKFTNFMLATVTVVIVAGHYSIVKKWRHSALVAGGFALAVFCFWIACGQSPSGIWSYLNTSLEVSRGYEAMAIYEKPEEMLAGLVMVLLIAASSIMEGVMAKGREKSVAAILILWTATYLNWKHGYIRAGGGHTLGFYLWALGIAAFYPLFFPYGRKSWMPGIGFSIAIAACSMWGIYRLAPSTFDIYIPGVVEQIHQNVMALTNPSKFERDLKSRFEIVANANNAPRIDRVLGRDTVDVFGFEQSIAILNGLNYTPRPIFQSYSAYTPMLAAMNAGFMRGRRAPEWILQRYETIDGRYPSCDDSAALLSLLDRYTYQFQDSGYVVWRRTVEKIAGPVESPQIAREGDAHLKEEIPVGDLASKSALWLEIDYSNNLFGSLRSLLYKPPKVTLSVTMADHPGVRRKFLFPRFIAKEGLVLSPYLASEYDFLKYAVGLGGPTVESIRMDCDRHEAKYLKRTFHYKVMYLPDPENLAVNRTMASSIRRYPMFDVVPNRINSNAPPVSVWQDGRVMLQVPAPSQIELSVGPGGQRLKGAFGLRTDASGSGPESEGNRCSIAEFQVVLREGTMERVLFDRVLDPWNTPADEGVQPLDVSIPVSTTGAMLLLNAVSKTPGERTANLTCWTGLTIQRENPGGKSPPDGGGTNQ